MYIAKLIIYLYIIFKSISNISINRNIIILNRREVTGNWLVKVLEVRCDEFDSIVTFHKRRI